MLSVKNKTTIGPLTIGIISLLTPVTLYFLYKHAFPRLYFTEENYGDYYWPRKYWLLTHVVFGIAATLSGPFQFIPSIRNKHWRLHRNLGKVYLVTILVAAITALYLAYTSSITAWYSFGLAFGAAVWLYTGAMAYAHIKNRRTKQHKHMMIRNYVVTFFFIIFFGFYDVFVAMGTDAYDSLMLSILPWACLLIPLMLTEYLIRRNSAILSRRT